MEPQLIDYYNEMPHGVNVIEKLNEEFDELQNKYKKYEQPIIYLNTFLHAIIIYHLFIN